MNEEAKRIAITRPRIIRAIQHYLDSKGMVEVETPVLEPIFGGSCCTSIYYTSQYVKYAFLFAYRNRTSIETFDCWWN